MDEQVKKNPLCYVVPCSHYLSYNSAPVYALILEKKNAVQDWRALMGSTDPVKAKSIQENR